MNEGDVKLEVFVDSDYAGDRIDRRSTTGYVIKIAGAAVSWSSKKQTTVALSTAESEFVAASACVSEILWFRGLLNEIGFCVIGTYGY